jgi:hypothetical protein
MMDHLPRPSVRAASSTAASTGIVRNGTHDAYALRLCDSAANSLCDSAANRHDLLSICHRWGAKETKKHQGGAPKDKQTERNGEI